jgi:hypothetical protein
MRGGDEEMEEDFKFRLGQIVRIHVSGEEGEVIARSDSQRSEDQYQVRYKSGDGRAVESWWTVSALSGV